jgi:hypothetical protein
MDYINIVNTKLRKSDRCNPETACRFLLSIYLGIPKRRCLCDEFVTDTWLIAETEDAQVWKLNALLSSQATTVISIANKKGNVCVV